MTESVILATLLSSGILITDSTEQGKQAVNNIAIATYKYTKFNKQVEPFIKKLENKYIPQIIRDAGVGGYFMYRLVADNRITYTWSF